MPQGAPASASQRLKLQAVTKAPGFYRGPGTLKADPHICATSSWSTESAPLLPFKFLLGEKNPRSPLLRSRIPSLLWRVERLAQSIYLPWLLPLIWCSPNGYFTFHDVIAVFTACLSLCWLCPPIEGDTCFSFLNHQDIRNCAIGSPPCLTSIPWTSS